MSKIPTEQEQHSEKTNQKTIDKITCGIIMPISGSNELYTAKHWEDVRAILDEAVLDAGFFPQIVSDANEVGIIHNRIVGNIYQNAIVVCDVSSKNPNVMFELGLRLAFDKATIIIKDTATNYNFDTSPIEHLEYPHDLRYSEINTFKLKLKNKLQATHTASKNPEYSTFLKNFIQWKPKLEEKEIGGFDLLTKRLDSLTLAVENMAANQNRSVSNSKRWKSHYSKFNPLFSTVDAASSEFLAEKFHDFLKQESNRKFTKQDAIVNFLSRLDMENSPLFDFISKEDLDELLSTIYENTA